MEQDNRTYRKPQCTTKRLGIQRLKSGEQSFLKSFEEITQSANWVQYKTLSEYLKEQNQKTSSIDLALRKGNQEGWMDDESISTSSLTSGLYIVCFSPRSYITR